MTRPRSPRAAFTFTVLLAAWCAATWALSASSDPESYVGVHLHLPDKLEHGIEYAVGGFLAAGVAASWTRRGAWAAAVGFCALWGTLDEVHQRFVPGRDSSPFDLAADVTGGAIGAATFAAAGGRRQSAARAVDEPSETSDQRRRT